jgi:hypothetical protein
MIKTDFKKPSLDLQLQNKSLLLFALGFTSIILINIFLEMINMNPYLHYILLLSLSGLTILFMDFSFSLVSSSFMSNKNLTITLNSIAWLSLIFFIFFVIDYSIYYKWNPEKVFIYSNWTSYLAAILLSILIYLYPRLRHKTTIQKVINSVLICSALLVSAYIASFLIINDYHIYNTNAPHIDVVIYPIVQVYLGKALMVDFSAQYGAYAHFMEPILKITGLSLISITSLFSLLMFVTLSSIAYALFKLLDNKLIAFVGFISFIYAIITAYMLYPYQLLYQIYPIRLMFPAYAILAGVFYFANPNRKSFIIHIAVLSMGVLWNIDIGLIVLASFGLAILFPVVCSSQFTIVQKIMLTLKDLLIILIVFSSVLFLYSFYINLRYGSLPDLYQMFTSFGFFGDLGENTQFPLNKTTSFGIFIYILAFIYVLGEFIKQKVEYITYVIFLLLLFGLGHFFRIFNHFGENGQLYSIYPALLILIIFADRRISYLKQFKINSMLELRDKFILGSNHAFLLLIISLIAYLSTFFFYHNNSTLFQNAVRINEFYPIEIGNKKLAWFSANKNILMEDIALDSSIESPWQERARKLKIFYNENALQNKKIAIFSMWDGYLHMKLNHSSPLPIINSQHVHVNQDWDNLEQLISSKSIDFFFVDTSFFRDVPRFDDWKDVINSLDKHYSEILKIPLQPSWNYLESEWQKTEFTIYHLSSSKIDIVNSNYH